MPALLYRPGSKKFIAEVRGEPPITVSRNLGPFVRNETYLEEFEFGAITCALPQPVQYAIGRIETISSSLTILTVQFVLNRIASESLERVLDHKRHDAVTRYKTHRAVVLSHVVMADEVRQFTKKIRRECESWMRKNLPGAFGANLLDGGDYPSCLFLTLDKGQPLNSSGILDDVQDRLEISYNDYAWESLDIPGLRLKVTPPPNAEAEFDLHWLMAGKRTDVIPEKEWGERPISVGSTTMFELSPSLGFALGVSGLVEGYSTFLARAKYRLDQSRGGIFHRDHRLGKLQFDLSLISKDVHPVLMDLGDFLRGPQAFGPNLPTRRMDFEAVPGSFIVPSDGLLEGLHVQKLKWASRTSVWRVARRYLPARFPDLHPKLMTSLIPRLSLSIRRLAAKELVVSRALETETNVLTAEVSIQSNNRLFWATLGLLLATIFLLIISGAEIWITLNSLKA